MKYTKHLTIRLEESQLNELVKNLINEEHKKISQSILIREAIKEKLNKLKHEKTKKTNK
jgi:hypothetical protein